MIQKNSFTNTQWNDRVYFWANQRMILRLLNTPEGRWLLYKDTPMRSMLQSTLPLVKVTPNSLHYLHDDKKTYTAHIYPTDRVRDIVFPILTKMSIGSQLYTSSLFTSFRHFGGIKKSPYLPTIYLDTFNPDAGGNGRVYVTNTDWTTARTATSGTADGTNFYVGVELNGADFTIYRHFMPTDTSSISDSATLISAVWNMDAADTQDADNTSGNDYIVMILTTQASGTALVDEDYDTGGSTEGSNQIDLTGGAGAKTFTLNATGLSWINLSGFTKFGQKSGFDLNNDIPLAGQTYTTWSTFVLTVTYSVPGGYIFIHN